MKKWSYEDYIYLTKNVTKKNSELMNYFNCTKIELLSKIKKMYKEQNRYFKNNK